MFHLAVGYVHNQHTDVMFIFRRLFHHFRDGEGLLNCAQGTDLLLIGGANIKPELKRCD
eukprot:SAG22_NODE_890_length_6647_cov_68.631185_2_plen_59_part_00